MKQFSLILFSLLVCSSSVRGGDAMPGDLLRTLNAAIDSSEVYTGYKKARIEELRLRKSGARSTEDIYRINCEIIDNYESFLCDSAAEYPDRPQPRQPGSSLREQAAAGVPLLPVGAFPAGQRHFPVYRLRTAACRPEMPLLLELDPLLRELDKIHQRQPSVGRI